MRLPLAGERALDRYRQTVTAAVAALTLSCAPISHAQSGLSLETSAGLQYDDNLLRLDDRAAAGSVGSACAADTIARIQAQLSVKIDAGGWLLNGSGGPSSSYYHCDTYLDFTGYQISVDVRRQPTGPIGITANLNALRQRSSFADVLGVAGNIQNFRRASGEVSLALTSQWRIVLDPQFSASTNSNPLYNSADYHSYGASAGLGWFTPLNNSLVFKASRTLTKGLHARLVTIGASQTNAPIDLEDTAAGFDLVYHPSVLSSVEASLFDVRRRDHSLLAANYSGLMGSLKLGFTPNDLLTLTLEAGRRLSGNDYLFIDSARTDFVDFNLIRNITNNSRLEAKIDYEAQQFVFNFASNTSGNASFKRVHLELAAVVRVLDMFTIRASVAGERGYGTVFYPTYRDTTFGLDVSYKFGNGSAGGATN